HPARTRLRENRFQQRVVLEAPHGTDRPGEFLPAAELAELYVAAADVGSDAVDEVGGWLERRGHQRRRSCRISRIASRLSATAMASGTADWLGDDGATAGGTGFFASSTVDLACAAASLAAAAISPLDPIRCCRSAGDAGGFGGAGAGLLA